MSERDDTGSSPGQALDTQIAERLFGWEPHTDMVLVDPARPRFGRREFTSWQGPAGEHRLVPPAYSTDPAATALVWQWLETQDRITDLHVSFSYGREGNVWCQIAQYGSIYTLAHEQGATWPEALCRAALALAETLTQEEGEA